MAFCYNSPSLLRHYPTYICVCRRSSRACGAPTWTMLLVLQTQHVPNQTDEILLKTCFPVSINSIIFPASLSENLMPSPTPSYLYFWFADKLGQFYDHNIFWIYNFSPALAGKMISHRIIVTTPLTGLPTSYIYLLQVPLHKAVRLFSLHTLK